MIINLKNEKTLNFWRFYFSTKLAKEKFDLLCNDSIDKLEKEKNSLTDFSDFLVKVTPILGKTYFRSMKDETFCEICSFEVNIALLHKHFNSKEHRESESYLIKRCMTYYEVCKKEIRYDERREYTSSKNHLEIVQQKYCKVCKVKYSVCGYQYTSNQDKCRLAQDKHNHSETHKGNQEFFDLYFR